MWTVYEDEGMKKIIAAGTIPAIEKAVQGDKPLFDKVADVAMIVNAYNEFFHTGIGRVEMKKDGGQN